MTNIEISNEAAIALLEYFAKRAWDYATTEELAAYIARCPRIFSRMTVEHAAVESVRMVRGKEVITHKTRQRTTVYIRDGKAFAKLHGKEQEVRALCIRTETHPCTIYAAKLAWLCK